MNNTTTTFNYDEAVKRLSSIRQTRERMEIARKYAPVKNVAYRATLTDAATGYFNGTNTLQDVCYFASTGIFTAESQLVQDALEEYKAKYVRNPYFFLSKECEVYANTVISECVTDIIDNLKYEDENADTEPNVDDYDYSDELRELHS